MGSCIRIKHSRSNGICNIAEKYKKINKKGKFHLLLEIDENYAGYIL